MGPVTRPTFLLFMLSVIPKFKLPNTYFAFIGFRVPGDKSLHLEI